MNLHPARIRRWLATCAALFLTQALPHPIHASAPPDHRALEPRNIQPPQSARPNPLAHRTTNGAEPMTMLPAEQHLGEFSEGDLAFISHAAVVHHAQRIYAKLALRRAQAGDVRHVAQQLVKLHRKAETDLANVVQPYGVVLPSSIDTEHQWLRAHLLEADAKAFDRVYVQSQIKEHTQAMGSFRDQVNHGKSQVLRAWARGVLVHLEEHWQMLQALDAPKPVS